jgi:hypothetical protein
METIAPKDERFALKIKIKSLAEEARIIRAAEDKLKGHSVDNFAYPAEGWKLYTHRKNVVRPEARATQLAYAYLRGVPYRKVEPIHHTDPSWRRVQKMVETYGSTPFDQAAFIAWRKDEVYVTPTPVAKSFVSRLLTCAFPGYTVL